MNMKVNFKQIVDSMNLPKSSALLPLFEAIANSIQSIRESKVQNGKIDICIKREKALFDSEYSKSDIHSFEIIDNGTGFNDEHYDSFNVYGTDYKQNI
jgi:hypothetical protein